jgi:hypothetical protein
LREKKGERRRRGKCERTRKRGKIKGKNGS